MSFRHVPGHEQPPPELPRAPHSSPHLVEDGRTGGIGVWRETSNVRTSPDRREYRRRLFPIAVAGFALVLILGIIIIAYDYSRQSSGQNSPLYGDEFPGQSPPTPPDYDVVLTLPPTPPPTPWTEPQEKLTPPPTPPPTMLTFGDDDDDNDDETPPPTPAPTVTIGGDTPAPTPTYVVTALGAKTEDELLDLLKAASIDGGTALEDTASLRYQAYQWVWNHPHVLEMTNETQILRYAFHLLNLSLKKDKDHSDWADELEQECGVEKNVGMVCEAPTFLRDDLLVGTIPDEIYLFTALKEIDLYLSPDVTGTIPTTIQLLTHMRTLSLTKMPNLGGTIPTQIGALTLLEELSLSDNALTGTVPKELGSLSQLTLLRMTGNVLTGTFPSSDVLPSLSNLVILYLGNAAGNLTMSTVGDTDNADDNTTTPATTIGTFPSELLALSNLDYLELHSILTGTIPTEVASMDFLHRLTLISEVKNVDGDNRYLTGPLPENVFNQMTTLNSLTIVGMDLDGTSFPEDCLSDCWNPSGLSKWNFSSNGLTGTLPTAFGTFFSTALLEFDLSHNAFSGPLPNEWATGMGQLTSLYVQSNQLTGNIPPGYDIDTTSIRTLYLQDNDFDGSVSFVCDDSDGGEAPYIVWSDCVSEVTCTCCEQCCQDGPTDADPSTCSVP